MVREMQIGQGKVREPSWSRLVDPEAKICRASQSGQELGEVMKGE